MKPSILKTEDLQTHHHFSSSVVDFTAAVHTQTNPEQLLEFAFEAVCTATNAHAGSLFLWDETSKTLTLNLSCGPYLEKRKDIHIPLKDGIVGWVAEKGKSVLVKDITKDYRFYALKRFNEYQTSSFISLPLVASNKLIGVINITEQKDFLPFEEDHLECAMIMAKHLAVAYENLKSQKRLRQENLELSREILELNETIKRQESFVSIGKLAAHLAHELNNPLDSIRRFVNLALDQVMEDSLAREYLLKARGGIRRAVQVIRGLLSFAREANVMHSRVVRLHDLLDQIILETQRTSSFKDISFGKEFCPDSVQVIDRGLRSVFYNLFENAHHAMKGKGTIAISTRQNGKYVVVSVRDTGCGIPEESRSKIFEPFFTTKPEGEGTGIGLAVCRDIIDRSNGEITCSSEIGEGTHFLIMLPLARTEEVSLV